MVSISIKNHHVGATAKTIFVLFWIHKMPFLALHLSPAPDPVAQRLPACHFPRDLQELSSLYFCRSQRCLRMTSFPSHQTSSPALIPRMSAISRKNARDLLSHLVAQLSDPPRGYERYKGLYDVDPTPRREGRDVAAIRNLLFTSMRTEVFEIFSAPNLKPKAET